ncbi:glycosyltransferase family 2 protein [Candidatus Sumerlaeota bacterium]|nr:glycosyltransferase family 2 protein [Candidatus Sumerlaeota bacterium]
MPVYNEHRTIEAVIRKVRDVPLPVEREILVVDGNSIDGTREILERHASEPDLTVHFESGPQGRGHALKEGLRLATGDVAIFQDADLELDPADYPVLLEPILSNHANVVFGSRFLAGRPRMGFLQYWGNRVINFSVNLLYGTSLTDVETCYQVFRREAIQDFTLVNNDFAFTVELTVKLIKAGHPIREIPIAYIPRGRAEGKKIYWADGFLSLWTLVKYRFVR